jgi:hypothetical protein
LRELENHLCGQSVEFLEIKAGDNFDIAMLEEVT